MPTSATDQQRDGSLRASKVEGSSARIDAGNQASVSFAATVGDAAGQRAPSSRSKGHEDHALVGVGPGIPGAMLLGGRAGLLGMNPFPIVGARIHPPLMRADTLSRERLNGWLDQAATGRVALVVAEAGFGKTTLLGDWARGSSRLTAWYRLDPDDRDWLTLFRHLVAGGRELDPDFAPETYALLMQLGPGGPTRADIQASLVREYADFAASHPQGLTLILDDYHAVDGSDEVVPTVRALIEETGPSFSIVIASRSAPRLPLGRLRARGAVSRIGGDALCFDVPETDRLFRDAYHMPIEPDVVDQLVERTEGWAALLSLVNVSLGEQTRPDPRAFVAHISANHGDLYDFLAEEVVASLPADLHAFLERASILTWVDTETAALVCEMDRSGILQAIRDAEGLGLLVQPDRDSPHRFHPLVRAFLLAQLQAEIGVVEIRAIHERVGHALESSDWATAAWHLREAGDADAAAQVVDGAIDSVFASGQFERTRPFLDGSTGSLERPGALILRSRLELARGNVDEAASLARRAVAASANSLLAGPALLNVSSILGFGGFEESAVEFAKDAIEAGRLTTSQHDVALATIAMWQAEHEGPLDSIADGLRDLAIRQSREGHHRYAGITRLNLAGVLLWLGEPREAIRAAGQAQVDLGGRAVGSPEYVSAIANEASAWAHIGHLDRAERMLLSALEIPSRLGKGEVYLETAKLRADFGDAQSAATALDQAAAQGSSSFASLANLIRGSLAIRGNRLDEALSLAAALASHPCTDVAGMLRGQLLRSRVSVLAGQADRDSQLRELKRIASAQRSRPVILAADLIGAASEGRSADAEIARILPEEMYCLSWVAEEVVFGLAKLSDDALQTVTSEAKARPARWSDALRASLAASGPNGPIAADLLGKIGSSDDAALLRSLAVRDKGLRPVASAITRRLAPRVQVSDLGIVELLIDDVAITRRLRRKVLGLLCFVSSRPGMACTRDEALEALWPDLAPGTAVNSLHQTIYFLRRLLEPEYREGVGAGYLQFDGEVLSLDADLVDSRSRRAVEAHWLLATRRPTLQWSSCSTLTPVSSHSTSLTRTGRLRTATTFMLPCWRRRGGDRPFDPGWQRRQRDPTCPTNSAGHPTADAIELQLLRAYKRGDRHAAAAEQYAHYSSMMRDDLGAEPPALADI